MQRAFLQGVRVALRCWRLTIMLWLVGVAFAAAFSSVSASWLSQALGGSLATRRLLRDLDPNVLIDLYYHHGAGLRLLAACAAVMAIAYVVAWIWFHGAIAVAVRANGTLGIRGSLRGGVDLVPVFAALFLLAAVALAVFSAAVGGSAWWLLRRASASPSEMTRYYIIGAAVLTWLGGAVALTAVHDHARLRAAAGGQSAWAAYWWAIRFVSRGGELALWLAVVLQATGLVMWMIYQAVGMTLPATSPLGLAGSLAWGELFLWARLLLRVWFFAAQNDLQAHAVVPMSFSHRGTEPTSADEAFAVGSRQLRLPLE